MAIIKFSTMDLGIYDTSVVVSAVTQTNTANNKPMVKITISDGDDTITAIQFDTTKADLAYAGIEEGITALIRLEITDYKGSKSYKIININPVKLPEDELKQLIKLEMQLQRNSILFMIQLHQLQFMNGIKKVKTLFLELVK